MRLLVACIDGLAWPLKEPPPFLAQCLQKGAAGPLSGFYPSGAAWRLDGEPFWPLFSQAGLKLGLMNLPGLWPAQPIKGFMVCRGAGGNAGGNWTHPPELAHDLGDYAQAKPLPSGAPEWRAPLKDTAFAEAAALARLRYEHFRRLCAQYQPEAAALGWSALATARGLFGSEAGRAGLMLAQLDAYLARLRDEFQPNALALMGTGWADQSGAVIMLAPDRIKAGRLPRAAWPEVLSALLDLAGLPSARPAGLFADLLPNGEAPS